MLQYVITRIQTHVSQKEREECVVCACMHECMHSRRADIHSAHLRTHAHIMHTRTDDTFTNARTHTYVRTNVS